MICRRRSAQARAALKAWNEQAARWDGQAIVYDPMNRRNVPADWYKDNVAGPMMHCFDRMPGHERVMLALSDDGYGNEAPVVIRR